MAGRSPKTRVLSPTLKGMVGVIQVVAPTMGWAPARFMVAEGSSIPLQLFLKKCLWNLFNFPSHLVKAETPCRQRRLHIFSKNLLREEKPRVGLKLNIKIIKMMPCRANLLWEPSAAGHWVLIDIFNQKLNLSLENKETFKVEWAIMPSERC